MAALPGFAKCADGAARLVEIEFQNYSSHHRGDFALCAEPNVFFGAPFSENRNRGFAIEARVTVARGGIKRRGKPHGMPSCRVAP